MTEADIKFKAIADNYSRDKRLISGDDIEFLIDYAEMQRMLTNEYRGLYELHYKHFHTIMERYNDLKKAFEARTSVLRESLSPNHSTGTLQTLASEGGGS